MFQSMNSLFRLAAPATGRVGVLTPLAGPRRKSGARSLLMVTLCAVLVASAGEVEAALISADFMSPGDELITRDTTRALDWLDWTETDHISYDDFEALLGPGGTYDGWRRATQADLDGFMQEAGVPDPGGRTVANVPFVTNIISLLGATNLFGSLGPGNSTVGFLASTLGGSGPIAAFTIEINDVPVRAKAGEIGSGSHTIAFAVGNAILRDAAPLPEPSSLALLGIAGVAVLASRASRLKA